MDEHMFEAVKEQQEYEFLKKSPSLERGAPVNAKMLPYIKEAKKRIKRLKLMNALARTGAFILIFCYIIFLLCAIILLQL